MADRAGGPERRARRALGAVVVSWLFVLAGAIVFPVTVLILRRPRRSGRGSASLYGGAGTVRSALVMSCIGGRLGREALYARCWASAGSACLEGVRKRGLLAVATFRLLPVAPFTLVNLAAGRERHPLRPTSSSAR